MAHKFDSGMMAREPAWHGLGTVVEDWPGDWPTASKLAGLEWDPVERPVYEVTELYADGRAEVQVIPDFKQIVRSDNGFRLAIANETYTITPNSVMGEIIEGILDQGDTVRYESAGSLDEGRRTWALLRLGENRTLTGDPSPIQLYLALFNSHDASSALRAIVTSYRVVCANTWHAAEMESARTGACYTFRHTKGWKDRVDQAKKALAKAGEETDKIMQRAEELLRVAVEAEQRRWFIREFAVKRVIRNTIDKMPVTQRNTPLAERLAQPKVKAAIESTVRDMNDILAGPTCEGIRGTAYGLMQAAGELTDHYRPAKTVESLFTRTMIDTHGIKCDAYKLARELAKA